MMEKSAQPGEVGWGGRVVHAHPSCPPMSPKNPKSKQLKLTLHVNLVVHICDKASDPFHPIPRTALRSHANYVYMDGSN
jgi:hypothetical protein